MQNLPKCSKRQEERSSLVICGAFCPDYILIILSNWLMSHWSPLSENSFLLTVLQADLAQGLRWSLPKEESFQCPTYFPPVLLCLQSDHVAHRPTQRDINLDFRKWFVLPLLERNSPFFFKRWLNRVLSWSQIRLGFRFGKKIWLTDQPTNQQLTSKF